METTVLVLNILFINLLLSADNAVAIAAVLRDMPARLRKRALLYGMVFLVIILVALTSLAGLLMRLTGVQVAGGILLEWIALKLVFTKDESEESRRQHNGSFIKALLLVIAIDLVMSLDNVIAIAGIAGKDFVAMVLGLAISIPLMIWGSQLICNLLGRYRLLLWVGAGILAWTASSVFLRDRLVLTWFSPDHYVSIGIGFVVAVMTLGAARLWMKFRGVRTLSVAEDASKASVE